MIHPCSSQNAWSCPAFTPYLLRLMSYRRALYASALSPSNQSLGNSSGETATSRPLIPALPPRGLKYTPPQLPARITCFGVKLGVNSGWSLNTSLPVFLSRAAPSARSNAGAKGNFGGAGEYPARDAEDTAALAAERRASEPSSAAANASSNSFIVGSL